MPGRDLVIDARNTPTNATKTSNSRDIDNFSEYQFRHNHMTKQPCANTISMSAQVPLSGVSDVEMN